MKKIIIFLCAIILILSAFIGLKYNNFNAHTPKVKISISKKKEPLKITKGITLNKNASLSKENNSTENTANKDKVIIKINPKNPLGTKPAENEKPLKIVDPSLENLIGSLPCKYSIGIKDLKTGKETFMASEGLTENSKMRSASIIKLFIMAEAFNEINEKKLEYTQEIKQLIEAMITASDNAATNRLIDYIGMDNLNKNFDKNNFTSSILQRKMLDMESLKAKRDNYTSTKDVINLFTKLYNNTMINSKWSNIMLELLKQQKVNTKIPVLLPPGTIVAHKTGELPPYAALNLGSVENDAGIVYTSKGAYIVSFLTSDMQSTSDIRTTIQTISKKIYDYFAK